MVNNWTETASYQTFSTGAIKPPVFSSKAVENILKSVENLRKNQAEFPSIIKNRIVKILDKDGDTLSDTNQSTMVKIT